MGSGSAEQRLAAHVRATEWLWRALVAARTVGAPDWLIGAGAVRDPVWDRLHGVAEPPLPKDVDLAFHDPRDLSREREDAVAAALATLMPDVRWDVANQARVHLWYAEAFGVEVEPLASSADAVATWPETASCVGLRLLDDDRLEIVAPYGLDALLGLVWERNPRRVTIAEYRRRLAAKDVRSRWPRAVVHVPGEDGRVDESA